jgi:hypothetical protein
MTEYVIPELDKKGLREFGLVTGGVVAGLFGVFFPWLFDRAFPAEFPLWPWVVFGVLGGWGLIAPNSLRPVYKIWMRFGLMLSKITTPIIMGLVFYVVITPFGLMRRLFGDDPMARKFENLVSYRVPSKKAPKKNLEKPF